MEQIEDLPVLQIAEETRKLLTPLQWSAARIVEQVVNAVQSAVNPVGWFTQAKNPSSDVGDRNRQS